MKKGKKPQQFIQKPTYNGGPKAMREFIGTSLQYPAEAQKAKIEGTVCIRMRINYKGQVDHTNIISSLGYGCDEEAQRVAELLKFKVPTNRGVRAHFHKTLNIHFRLPKAKEVAPNQQLQYTVVKQVEEKSPEKETKGYGYTIQRSS